MAVNMDRRDVAYPSAARLRWRKRSSHRWVLASIDQDVAKAYGPNMPYQRAANDANPETPYRSGARGPVPGPDQSHRMIYAGDNAR
jgi:hypothetical protein